MGIFRVELSEDINAEAEAAAAGVVDVGLALESLPEGLMTSDGELKFTEGSRR